MGQASLARHTAENEHVNRMLAFLPDMAVIQTPLVATVLLPGRTCSLRPDTQLGGDERHDRGLGVGSATWMRTQNQFDSHAGAKGLGGVGRGRTWNETPYPHTQNHPL